jgi:hypothetical protein
MTYNIDDTLVYLSWMRQVVEGAFFQKNLFAIEPQRGMVINLFALLLGGIAKVTQLPLITVYQGARLLFGACVLWAVVPLLRETLSTVRARYTAFALICFASGCGWLFGGYDPALGFVNQPLDLWQPEAITFLSIYYSPLFTAALALITVFVTAVLRFERTNRWGNLLPAGIASALLANFHTYDIIPLFLGWGVFRIVADIGMRKLHLRAWLGVIIVGVATLPTFVYQYWALIQDPIFQTRNVKTPSALPVWFLLGLGLPVFFAFVGVFAKQSSLFRDNTAKILLSVWVVIHTLVAYLPVDFQGKLVMGIHIPLCILAGAGLVYLVGRLPGKFPTIALLTTVLLTLPSNLFFLMQDTERLSVNAGSTENRPYLTQNEVAALEWLQGNVQSNEIIFTCPDPTSHKRFPFFALKPYLSMFVPAWTGAFVYNGHGSETPQYGRKLNETLRFFAQTTEDEFRQSFVQENRIRYIVYANSLAESPPSDAEGNPLTYQNVPYLPVAWREGSEPGWLKQKYRNTEITVYEVLQP